MPLARISVPIHLPLTQVQDLADAVHNGLVIACGVPTDDRFQLITRFTPETMILNPTFGNVSRSSDASIIEVTFLSGRTDEQKSQLFKLVVNQAVKSGFREDDIMITLIENSAKDWSLGRGEVFSLHE